MSGPSSPPELSHPARRRPLYKDYNVLQLALVVFLLDQLTKYLTIQLLAPGHSFPMQGFFRFTHVHNTGSAFGILQGLNTPLIFVSFIGIIILVLIYRSQPQPGNLLRLSLGLQLGGAFGNLVDRLRLGFVTDFIDIGPWPVFNLADASIVTGLVLLVWVFTRPRPAGESTGTGAAPETAGPEIEPRQSHAAQPFPTTEPAASPRLGDNSAGLCQDDDGGKAADKPETPVTQTFVPQSGADEERSPEEKSV